jgi:hypothetical protein
VSESTPFDKNRFKIARIFKLRDCDFEKLLPEDSQFFQEMIDVPKALDSSTENQMREINEKLCDANSTVKEDQLVRSYKYYLKECRLLEKKKFEAPYVNDTVFGNIHLESWERMLIDTCEMQRLRSIHQLGLAYLVYPNATHCRFAHVLGTKYLANLLLKELYVRNEGKSPLRLEEFLGDDSDLFKAVTLLHDIGHGPFSHAGEYILKKLGWGNHEVLAEFVIEHGVQNTLKSKDIEPSEVMSIIKEEVHDEPRKRIISELISSALGIDRMDYLLRDAHNTGVNLGHFDINRLIASLTIAGITINEKTEHLLALREKGFGAFESFVLARDWMYDRVYLHKTVRSAEKMLQRAIYEKIKTEKWKKEDFCARYFSMSDDAFLQWLENSESEIVQDLIYRIRNRRLYVRTLEIPLSKFTYDKKKKFTEMKDSRAESFELKWIGEEDSFSEEDEIMKGEVLFDILQNNAKKQLDDIRVIPILKEDNGTFSLKEIVDEEIANPLCELLRVRGENMSAKITVFSPREKKDKVESVFEERYLS